MVWVYGMFKFLHIPLKRLVTLTALLGATAQPVIVTALRQNAQIAAALFSVLKA